MGKSHRLFLVAFCALIMSPYSEAAEWTPMMRGVGTESCGSFVAAMGDLPVAKSKTWKVQGDVYYDKSFVYSEWIQGYLTAFNLYNDMGRANTIDYAAIDLWMRNWCKSHPTSRVMEAIGTFVEEVRKVKN